MHDEGASYKQAGTLTETLVKEGLFAWGIKSIWRYSSIPGWEIPCNA